MIADIKRRMHILIEELKTREKTRRREVVKQVEEKQREIAEKLAGLEEKGTVGPSIDQIKAGDTVYVRSVGYDAEVVSLMEQQNRVRVSTGNMEIEVPLSDIAFMKGKTLNKKSSKAETESIDEAVQPRINIIGLRVDEAISRLEPFLNHASLAGLTEVTVIHGLGAGILSKAVREHLKGHPLVKEFRAGERSEGGEGVTVAKLA